MKLGQALHRIKKPWFIMLSMVVGVLIGLYSPSLTNIIAPVGNVYLKFLQMCIVPLIVFAIISSVGRLILSGEAAFYLKRIFVVFLLGFFFTSGLGLLLGMLGTPGSEVGEETRVILGEMLYQQEAAGHGGQVASINSLSSFVELVIPTNIFTALLEEHTLQILLFSLIFGIAIGLIPSASTEQLISMAEIMFKAMEKMVAWTLYILPFALISLMSSMVMQTGANILQAMISYVAYIHIAAILLIIFSAVFISIYYKISLGQVFQGMKEPWVVAFGTRNSYAAMPAIFHALEHSFNVDKRTIHLIVPLSIIVCRYSMLLVFTLGTVFMLQLYDMPITIETWGIILFGAILAAVAGAGTPSVVATAMIAIVLTPLGLPIEASIILLLAINPIIDPILTVINVHMTSMATMLISNVKNKSYKGEIKNENERMESGKGTASASTVI